MWFLLQAALEKGKNIGEIEGDCKEEELVPLENSVDCGSESVNSLASQVSELAVSANPGPVIPPDSTEDSNPGDPIQDIDKRIRALKKKVLKCIAMPVNDGKIVDIVPGGSQEICPVPLFYTFRQLPRISFHGAVFDEYIFVISKSGC